MKRFEKEGRAVSPHALVTLFAGTVIILFQLFYIIFDTLCGTHENFYYTVALYQKCLDYVLTEAVIVVSGSFLMDMTVGEYTA